MTDISVMGEWQVVGVGGTRPLWNVLGEAIEGRFSFEARNYLFSFLSYVRFEEFFCFPRFRKIWRQTFKLWGFWLRRCFGALFENSAPSPGIFLRTLTTTTSISWKFPFFFPKQSRFYLPDSYDDPKSEQSTSVMVRRKPEWKLDFRALARSSAEGPSIVVAIGTRRVRWSMVQKRKKKTQGSQRVIVRRLHPSSSTNQRVLRSLFPRPDVATVSHFAVFVDVDVQQRTVRLQRGDSEEKRSHPWHFRCWSLRRNELECTNLVHWTEALHRFSSRDAIIVVCSVLEKHFDGDFTPDQEKKITFKRWPPGYQSWKLGLALNGLRFSLWLIRYFLKTYVYTPSIPCRDVKFCPNIPLGDLSWNSSTEVMWHFQINGYSNSKFWKKLTRKRSSRNGKWLVWQFGLTLWMK